jgi:hypothetical protein
LAAGTSAGRSVICAGAGVSSTPAAAAPATAAARLAILATSDLFEDTPGA